MGGVLDPVMFPAGIVELLLVISHNDNVILKTAGNSILSRCLALFQFQAIVALEHI